MELGPVYHNERDVEIPHLFRFVDSHTEDITTILDIGCFDSQYLKGLKERRKTVDGIDIRPGEREKEFLRNYFVGNAVSYPLGQYDLVVCLSTLEHAGVEYRVDDFAEEQNSLFRKVVDASKRFMYVTFPYGSPAVHEAHFANVTRNRLDRFLGVIPDAVCKRSFYFTCSREVYQQIAQEEADSVQYDPTKGVRCVCILEVIL